MKNLPIDKCVGCELCKQVCPKKCINMIKNEEGFYYPKVNTDICIKCGLCEKKCPILKETTKNNNLEVYAAYTKDIESLNKSSSGGIFYEIAKHIIKNKGVVYGVTFNREDYAYYTRVDSINELNKILGSKYIQAKVNETYKKIKEDLIKNNKVLFCGTPCQVAALKSYLGKEYSNLLTLDFICTGVPSISIFDDYVSYYEKKYHQTLNNIEFRNKKNGWYNYQVKMSFDKKKKQESRFFNPLIKLHYTHLSIRKSCFYCKYKDGVSESDIQLGDFWNVDFINKNIYNKNGVSVVIIQSKLGEEIFNSIKEKLEYDKVTIEELKQVNKSYYLKATELEKRNKFFDEYVNSKNKIEIIKKYTKIKKIDKLKTTKNLLSLKMKGK